MSVNDVTAQVSRRHIQVTRRRVLDLSVAAESTNVQVAQWNIHATTVKPNVQQSCLCNHDDFSFQVKRNYAANVCWSTAFRLLESFAD
jgi:hypothetical protein